MRAVAVLAGALGQRGSEIRLPGSGEALEHHVLSSLDEGAGPQLGEDAAIQAAFLDAIDPAQVRVGVTQPSTTDEPVDLRVRERGMRIIDGELDTLFERHPQGEGGVLSFERLQQAGCTHLAELVLGLCIQLRHFLPPA